MFSSRMPIRFFLYIPTVERLYLLIQFVNFLIIKLIHKITRFSELFLILDIKQNPRCKQYLKIMPLMF